MGRDRELQKNGRNPYLFFKRFLDVLFSFLLLFFLSLPMLAIAISIAVTSRGGVIFKQTRVGRNGETFICYKFRTMYSYAPSNIPTASFSDAHLYVTAVGRFLRRTSLDELPQLFNVLKGDMSLVGPRPLICEEESVHSIRRKNGVYSIRPGITGLAQVSGRDLLSDSEKAALDVMYFNSVGFSSDIKIFLKTLKRVVSGNGIR
jgi:O-antigen biosynthesis protein WbqP